MVGMLKEKGEPKLYGEGHAVMNGLIECPRQDYYGDGAEPEIFEFTAFKDTVGRISRITTGSMVFIEGSLRSKEYEKDGRKRLFTNIVIKSMRVV
jgi:single-stranded DNA-binding protein